MSPFFFLLPLFYCHWVWNVSPRWLWVYCQVRYCETPPLPHPLPTTSPWNVRTHTILMLRQALPSAPGQKAERRSSESRPERRWPPPPTPNPCSQPPSSALTQWLHWRMDKREHTLSSYKPLASYQPQHQAPAPPVSHGLLVRLPRPRSTTRRRSNSGGKEDRSQRERQAGKFCFTVSC